MKINASDESKEVVENALALVRSRMVQFPQDETMKVVFSQVSYLHACCIGSAGDRFKVSQLDVGVYAVRELEFSDPDLAAILIRIQYIADKIGAGLKV